MMDQKCCDKEGKCDCGSKGGMMMGCCHEHAMSKEHLGMKKEMLEKKLKWVNEELAKK